jgi:tetratricopeptide (TPR) repeat protein
MRALLQYGMAGMICISSAAAETSVEPLAQALLENEQPLSVAEAEQVQKALQPRLADDDAIDSRALALAVLAEIARGEVAAAEQLLNQHAEQVADSPELQMARLTLATVAGNAQAADRLLDEHLEHTRSAARDGATPDRETLQRITRLREYLRNVGERAPAIELDTGGEEPTPLPPEQGLAVLVFWKASERPTETMLSELQAAATTAVTTENPPTTLVMVNSDSRNARAEADAFVANLDSAWQHVFEERASRPPITFQTFQVRFLPAVAVIDARGAIRAVMTADDPRAVYTIRAAAREAAGKAPTVVAVTRSGEQPTAGALAKGDASEQAAEAPEEPPQVGADVPVDNREAEKLLQSAHSMRRLRSYKRARELYEQVIEQYPGTKQALEAEEYIKRLPR